MKETWNPAEISEDIKPVNYVNADAWNAAELNEAIDLFGIKYPVDTWNPAELDEKARNIINDITSTKTITGNPISFKTINGGYAKSCEVTFSPIQSGSGDPSPENVRPISGRDSLDLWQSGKNQLDDTNSAISGANMWYYGNGNTYKFWKAGTYTFSYEGNSATTYYTLKDGSNITIITTLVEGRYKGNFTLAQDGYYRFFTQKQPSISADDVKKPMITLSTADQTYTEYQGETHTATFPDTVYGGSHEFVSGKAKSEWGYIASYNGETITEPWISDRDVYVAGTTPSTGAEVCYKLATPQEITLTPETIELLKGNNVLFTDGDNITLKYTKLALPDDSNGLSLNQKVKKAIEIIKGKEIKEETKKSTTKGRRKKS